MTAMPTAPLRVPMAQNQNEQNAKSYAFQNHL